MHSLIYSLVCNYYGRKVGKKERKKADGRERRKKVKDPTETEKQQDTPTLPPSHHYYQYHYPLKKLQVLLNCVHKMPKNRKKEN